VTGQMPAANASVAAGSEIVLYCGREPDTDMTTVPDLTGMNYQTARNAMAEYGLYICEEGSILPGDTVTVISQSTQAGSKLEKGSVVAVVLSDSSNLGRY
jgi:beta-lactam-binding protein with PASTA domain